MERGLLDGIGASSSSTPYYTRPEYVPTEWPQEVDRESRQIRDRLLRSNNDRYHWRKAVDDFIEEKRTIRDRSPVRERGYRDSRSSYRREGRRGSREKDSRRNSEGRDYYKSSSPRDDDRSSSGSGRYRDSVDARDYGDDKDDSKDWVRKRDRWNDDDDRRYKSSDYRDDDRKWSERSRERDHSRERSSRSKYDERSSKKKDDWKPYNEDSHDSSETRDSDYERNGRSIQIVNTDWGNISDIDKLTYKDQVPNRTIIIRGLAQHITENDIRQDTIKCKLVPKDIRLIRKKNTGTSRGFAFVEFLTTSEAISWMEMKQGELMLKDQYRAVMQYSLQRMENGREVRISDWHCTRCSAHNFKRRDFCYKCSCTRSEGELMEGFEEVCLHPTNTVLLRGLDALTTEENVLQAIQEFSSLPIRSVRIGRDAVTNTSRGVCYLEMNSVVDAVYLHNSLLLGNPVIDGKQAIVSYCRLHPVSSAGSATLNATPSSLASAAIAAAQWSHQKTGGNCGNDAESTTTSSAGSQYTLDDVNKLAEYSANLYATNSTEKASYLTYYQDYYRKAISSGEQISLPSSASIAAQHAATTGKQSDTKTATASSKTPLTEPPNGSGEKTYPVPDVSTYQYDKSSGYYYDPFTTLYYDANSQYYYNQKIQKFLYWDSTKNTYLPAPTAATAANAPTTGASSRAQPMEVTTEASKEEEKKAKEKEKVGEKDKVKVAKRIAKDMEKWAKTLNHKKEIARQNLISQQAAQPSIKAQGAADIGFAVLERKDLQIPTTINNIIPVEAPGLPADNSLVAAYGQGSDSEDDGEDPQAEERKLTDWSKLACLLCKRQFPSKDVLIKHQQMSDLHKQNLEQWYKSRGLDMADAQQKTLQYRDRAKERRQKYGEPDQPQPNRLKETYMKAREATVSYEEPTKMGLGSDNLGNKLLQKMGWQEGMGLGKKNQGRTSIIETQRRTATAGLGTKSQGVVPGPGETYKDCVKKMMKIRYQELDNK